MKTIKVKLTLTESLLGTASTNKEIHREFIASKAPDASTIKEEVAAIGAEAVADKSMTVFPRDAQGRVFVYDYQIKGFLKEACRVQARIPGTVVNKTKAYIKIVDGLVFVYPRRILLDISNGVDDEGRPSPVISILERPLRAQTAQGERIALASSEQAPAGTTLDVEFKLLDDDCEKLLLELLNYGQFKGLGQWRNASHGRFAWKLIE